MKTGMALIFQNAENEREDREVYLKELALGDLAEPLGFQSLWSVEHHFTDYTMCPDVVQFLAYFSGRTKEIELGTAVVVLPWHDPMRVAEEISMLDHMNNGRTILGIGRGLGRVEFEGFRLDMNKSRGAFVEYAQMLLEGLERGWCEFDGEHIKQPRRDIRPAPFKSFRGRTYAAAVSPESVEIMAKLGVGILVIPQKPWDELIPELDSYRTKFRQYTGTEAPPTLQFGWTYCHEDEQAAYEGAVKYIGGYYNSVLKHYELRANHMKNLKGYEYYAKMQDGLREAGEDAAIKFFLDLQIWGTPEQCYNKIAETSARIHSDHFTGVFSYAGMAYEDAERNLKLFAKKVMPELQRLAPVGERVKAAAAE
ncbi:MAG: LLM class flavin-dependent oxidoreductase [Parvibaculum sp.]